MTVLVAVLAVSTVAILPVQANTTGYVHSLGYWRTHNVYATVPTLQDSWPVPEHAQLCSLTYYDIVMTPPKGCAWRMLARQWVVALLNAVDGAELPPDVYDAMWVAEALLGDDCTITEAEHDLAISLAELLTAYNEGLLGVPAYPE